MEKDLHVALLLDYYGELLGEKQRRLVDSYYNSDLSLSEISENEGITRQGVRDGIKRAEAFLLDCDRKLRLIEKNKMNVRLAEEIVRATQELTATDAHTKQTVQRILHAADRIANG